MFTENRKKQLVGEACRRLREKAEGLTGIVSGYYCNELRDREATGVWASVEISFFDGEAFKTADTIVAFFPDDNRLRCVFRSAAA